MKPIKFTSTYLITLILISVNILFIFQSVFAANKQIKTQTTIKLLLNDASSELKAKLEKYKDNLIQNNDILHTSDNIDFWANEWKLLFAKFLHSQGYYSCNIEYSVSSESDHYNINYYIRPSYQYIIGQTTVKIIKQDKKQDLVIPSPDIMEFHYPQVATAEDVLAKEQQIREFIEENNCLLDFKVWHEAFIDHPHHQIDILFLITAGPEAYINQVEFKGLKTVNSEYATKLVAVKPNTCFKYSKILEAKHTLQQSGLFLTVNPIIPKEVDSNSKVDIQFKVKEKKHHTIKTGLQYNTDLGAGITAEIENRNVLGRGEKFNSVLSLAKSLQSLDNTFKYPFFLLDFQTLKLQNIVQREKLDAYHNQEISILAALEQNIFSKLTLGEGIKYGFNKVTDTNNITNNFALLAFPLYASSDFRDQILDPSKGGLIKLEVIPYVNTINRHTTFLKKQLTGSCYLNPGTKDKFIIAVKGQVGNITGTQNTNLPVNEKFFGGGGSSIRGYGYKTIGPLNSKNEALGGNSKIELSTELRLRLSKSVGIVGFVDGGNVFETSSLRFKEKLLYSSGFGLRYYTSFGPIRADIAFPLNRRNKIDKAFQLYFSIGQSF